MYLGIDTLMGLLDSLKAYICLIYLSKTTSDLSILSVVMFIERLSIS